MIRYRWTIIILILFVATSALSLSAPGQSAAAFQGQAVADVPFFSQTTLRDQRASSAAALALGNSDLPLWERGCGVASLAMVYRHYGVDTDVVRLNGALRQAGAFSGALLAWDRAEALRQAGAPWI